MKDDWVSAALSDDTVVVDLLFRLKKPNPSSSSSSSQQLCSIKGLNLPTLNGWGHRQPRSKPSLKKTCTTTTTTATRCSPTTPLSWSGGATGSPSDGSDLSSAFRSKATFTNDTSNVSSSTSKRSKKKRSSTVLKEEENLLLKENVHLKRELASIHVTLNEQRARSENLKRIKFDLNLQSSNDLAAESAHNQYNLLGTSRTNRAESALSRHTMDDDLGSSESHRVESLTENQNRGFVLPDLNAMPSEDEIGTLWN